MGISVSSYLNRICESIQEVVNSNCYFSDTISFSRCANTVLVVLLIKLTLLLKPNYKRNLRIYRTFKHCRKVASLQGVYMSNVQCVYLNSHLIV